MATALGGHGEHVERPEELAPALGRALASARPACVNVVIDGVAAPTYNATKAPAH
jgi:acetolactate synthase-1/2/3 large subunit